MNPLDPVMLAAAAAGSVCAPPTLLDSMSSPPTIADSAATRFAPFYQHLLHHMPPTRNQQHLDLLTYHAAALHQHLAVAAAAAAASGRPFQQCQQIPSSIASRIPHPFGAQLNGLTIGDDDGKAKKSACIGYSVADLLADHPHTTSCDRIDNVSSPDSGNNARQSFRFPFHF